MHKIYKRIDLEVSMGHLNKIHWMAFDDFVTNLAALPFILQVVHVQIVAAVRK